ncbi:MAG: methyltransferase [Candidatus Heimdallarchaeota archaeon]
MGKAISSNDLTLFTHKTVYQPREDSYLLVDNLSKFITNEYRSEILEMGSGIGIISLNALKNFPNHQYYAVDINFDAALLTLKNMKHNNLENLHIICSDLVSSFRKGINFDIVIFNPPYLPPDEFDKHLTIKEKQALVGGKTGIETTIRLIENCKGMTNRIVVIVSSLTTSFKNFQDIIFPWNVEIIDEINLDFEKLWLIMLTMEVQV